MAFPSDPRPHRSRDLLVLAELPGGAAAILESARLPAPDRALLAALGLRRGALLKVRCGGAPCIVQVESARVALAGPLARQILVRPAGAGEGRER
jgi:Fe2+ transport system protein FeoA